MAVIFSWTISIGTIFEVVTILICGIGVVWSTKARIDFMAIELGKLQVEISKLTDILTKLAVQDQRILAVEKNVDELRHGMGFIIKPATSQV